MTDNLMQQELWMPTPVTSERSPLLPDRHPTADVFVCDFFDAAAKSDIASMEYPIFSLSTKPDHHVRRFEHGEIFVEIKPSADGLATVFDRDIVTYAISHVMAAKNAGKQVSQVVRCVAYDMLKSTNRMTNGRGYAGFKAALDRLDGTRIRTNVVTGGEEIYKGFGLIDGFEIVRATRDGRMQEVEIKLSDWVFNAIRHNEVLTMSRDYYRLRKPIERRMYELARKHCGRQSEWRISMSLLQKKCGATSSPREFRRLVTNIISQDQVHSHIPDYSVSFADEHMVLFRNRGSVQELPKFEDASRLVLRLETYDLARLAAPGWDVYQLEQEWRIWMTEMPHDADAAFIGFCRIVFERRGMPG